MYENFDFDVVRDDEKTVITVSKCKYITALYLLGLFKKKFGNWTSGIEIKLWGPGTLSNSSVNISVTIPAPTNPRHTRESFTREHMSGYFSGLREYLKKVRYDDLFMALKDEVGIT